MSSPQPYSCSRMSSDTSSDFDRKQRKSLRTCQDEHSPEPKSRQQSYMEDFPVNSLNPFYTQFCGSDVVLIVEGKKLHTHRQILALSCSYFRVLLSSKEFAETNAQEIELKGDDFLVIEYDAMALFLKHMYPVHSFYAISDDTMLMEMFPLADYFQCRHVRVKCEDYLQHQIDLDHVATSAVCLYLWLCEKYGTDKFFDPLVSALCRKQLSSIESNEHFKSLSLQTKNDVLTRRVRFLERKLVH